MAINKIGSAIALSTMVSMTGCDNKKVDNTVENTSVGVSSIIEGETNYAFNCVGGIGGDRGELTFNSAKNCLLYPILVETNYKTDGIAQAHGEMKFNRSKSLIDTTTGDIEENNVSIDRDIAKFIKTISKDPIIDDRIIESYRPKSEINIDINSIEITSYSSPEGILSDAALILQNNEESINGNNEIAIKRAEAIVYELENQLNSVAIVNGTKNITINSKIDTLNNDEHAIIHKIALEHLGDRKNVMSQLISIFNNDRDSLPDEYIEILDKFIGDKRIAELNMEFTGEGINPQVDVSKWNYALWYSFLAILLYNLKMYIKKHKKSPNIKNDNVDNDNL